MIVNRPPLLELFPSPQGGSETEGDDAASPKIKWFPSPQGGSETGTSSLKPPRARSVSIPSRRVGDHQACLHYPIVLFSFHPLKAGRRLPYDGLHLWTRLVSIPSRRVGDADITDFAHTHPRFPSPQGGSETGRHNTSSTVCCLFPSPQGGSETG